MVYYFLYIFILKKVGIISFYYFNKSTKFYLLYFRTKFWFFVIFIYIIKNIIFGFINIYIVNFKSNFSQIQNIYIHSIDYWLSFFRSF